MEGRLHQVEVRAKIWRAAGREELAIEERVVIAVPGDAEVVLVLYELHQALAAIRTKHAADPRALERRLGARDLAAADLAPAG